MFIYGLKYLLLKILNISKKTSKIDYYRLL